MLKSYQHQNVVLLFCMFFFGTTLDAGCGEKRAFDQVHRFTEASFATGRSLTFEEKRGLGDALRKIDQSALNNQLARKNLGIHTRFITLLLGDLATLQKTGEIRSTHLARQDLQRAVLIFDQLCVTDENLKSPAATSTLRRLADYLTGSFSSISNDDGRSDGKSLARLSALLIFVTGIISAIFLAWKTYVYVFSLVANRRRCKIAATLYLGDVEVSGNVAILGMLGNRFVPNDEKNAELLLQTLKHARVLPRSVLKIRERRFAVKLHLVTKTHCVNLFDTRLDRITLNALFGYSTIQTQYVAKNIIKSNLHEINPNFA